MTTTTQVAIAVPSLEQLAHVASGRALDAQIDQFIFQVPDHQASLRPAPYSRSLVDAWRVVHRLETCGYWLRLDGPRVPRRPWRAGFTPHGERRAAMSNYAAFGASPAEAICKAAVLVSRFANLTTEQQP